VRRSETHLYCESNGLKFDRDSANDNVRFERSVVRNKVVAAIEDHWGEASVRAMARAVERMREDAAALDQFAQRLYSDISRHTEDGTRFDMARFLEMPRALRHRVLDRAVGRIRDRTGGIQAALDALDAGRPRTEARFSVAQGIEIVIDRDQVLVIRPPSGRQTT
jgi:tRNA(Ile)-lysidine synthase TilS/MesJ